MDDRDDSSNSVGVGEASVSDHYNYHQCHHYLYQVSPPRLTSRQRLVLRLRRIHDTYYMVEGTDHPDYLNYSHIRSESRSIQSKQK